MLEVQSIKYRGCVRERLSCLKEDIVEKSRQGYIEVTSEAKEMTEVSEMTEKTEKAKRMTETTW